MSSYSKGFRDAWAESASDVERLAADNDNLRARAERAEAELARVRPVVDAAEALVEHRAEGSWKVTTREAALWDKRHGGLLDVLVAAVKEAQR